MLRFPQEDMAAGISAAVGVCLSCKRCCSLVRAAYHYIAAVAPTPPLAAAVAGAAPQHATVGNLLLGLLELTEPLSWGLGGASSKKQKKKTTTDKKKADSDGSGGGGEEGDGAR